MDHQYLIKDGNPYLVLGKYELDLVQFVYVFSLTDGLKIIGYGRIKFFIYRSGKTSEVNDTLSRTISKELAKLTKQEGDKFAERDILNLLPPPQEITDSIASQYERGHVVYKDKFEVVGNSMDRWKDIELTPFRMFMDRIEYVPKNRFASWLFRNHKDGPSIEDLGFTIAVPEVAES